MKYLLFLTGIAFFAITGWPQPSEEVNALVYFREGKLDKAKESIDAASQHPKTKELGKTWKLRGDIYARIYSTQNQKGFKKLSDQPIEEAIQSYAKALELGLKKDDEKRAHQQLQLLQNFALNEGVMRFNEKAFKKARTFFDLTIKAAELNSEIDSLAIYNSGLASERLGDTDAAIRSYEKCTQLGYKKDVMYAFLYFIYVSKGDDVGASKSLKEGLEKYPNSSQLMTNLLNEYLKTGKLESALPLLDKLTTAEPENKQYHYSKGAVLDALKRYHEAESSYKRALEIDPDYFDARYNLGANYFNRGVELNNKSNEIQDPVEFKKMKQEADAEFFKAERELSKAAALDPRNTAALNSLMQIYARTNDMEKYKTTKEQLQKVQYGE